MIGLFGLYHSHSGAPVDATPFAATIPDRYSVHSDGDSGAALGCVMHPHDRSSGLGRTPNSRISVAAIGEIFNAKDIAKDAPTDGLASLALHLAERDALDRLANANGLFALALYDHEDHRLTLVTDRHASFPIHLWRDGREIVFAGQIFTLLADRRVPRKADRSALAQIFTMQRTIGRTTSVANVEALPAATIWEFDSHGVRERCYRPLTWRRPDFDLTEGAKLLGSALRQAVVRQAHDGIPGLLLSGGIDSRMVLAAAPSRSLSCWTTASYEDNPELALARAIAEAFSAEHHTLIVDPPDTLPILERTVIDSNGLYPGSTSMAAFLPAVGAACQTILTGHGLDFTLRGYYLPARFAEIGGSRTRLPTLRPIPKRPNGADVLHSLRQGPPLATIRRIVAKQWLDEWWNGQASAMDALLRPWLDSDEPYNAWDAFILHALSKHYAFTGMMATRAVANLRLPAFDGDVFDIYLRMPPSWRCDGKMVKRALGHLSPAAASLPNANTHFRADLDPWLEVVGLMARAGLRRLGLAKRPRTPSAYHSSGSWQDVTALYRDESHHRARFLEIRQRLDALTFGVMDSDALGACIDEHLDGRAKHTKLLRQLLTHDAWVRTFGIAGSA